MSEITVTLQGTTKDADGYRALCREMSKQVEANEPDTIVYDWHLGAGGKFRNTDSYTSSEAFLAHMGAATELGFLERYMALVEIERVEVVGEASPDATAALAQFGAIHLESIYSLPR